MEVKVSAAVSRHNSDQDRLDDSLWEELQHRIEMIVNEHQYQTITAMVL